MPGLTEQTPAFAGYETLEDGWGVPFAQVAQTPANAGANRTDARLRGL